MALVNKAFLTTLVCITISVCMSPQYTYTAQQKTKPLAKKQQAHKTTAQEKNTTSTPTPKKTTSISQEKKAEPKALPIKIDTQARLNLHEEKRTIEAIEIQGNKTISQAAIVNAIPVKVGDTLNINYTHAIIKNIYNMGYFHQVKVYADTLDNNKVKLIIVVEEKPKLNAVTFVGNKAISEKELKEHLNVENIATLAQEELKALIIKLKKLYHRKNYHGVDIKASLKPDENNTVNAEFTIKENKKSFLNRISFKGNKHIPSKKLKRIIYSQEDWLFSFLNRAGVYNSEMVEGDKYMIEEIYRNNGFVNAKVTNFEIEKDPETNNHHITYTVHEGDRYRLSDVVVEGNEIVPTERLRNVIPMYPGQIYSSENLRTSLENLRMLWGEFGYIFADIEPNVTVNEENKTVSVTFNTDLKDQVYLNRITIHGNKKTRDKVIRRQLLVEEGALITNQKMELSKACVGLLGYFDPKNGVAWKTTRIDDSHADLDLMLNEVKTGNFGANISFGGSPGKSQTPQTGLSGNINFGDRNFLGSGIALAASTDISKRYKSFQASVTNPWLFDRPIRGTLAGYIKSSEYDDQINIAQDAPLERNLGGILSLGYVTKMLGNIIIDGKFQFENITYSEDIVARRSMSAGDRFIAQVLLNKYFPEGNQFSLIGSLSQDKRNGSVFPTNGYQWNWFAQWSFPGWKRNLNNLPDCSEGCRPKTHRCSDFNYFKTELDASWYTPLIGEHDLILCLHGNLGIVHPFAGKDIPWKNLYHVGGPQSIRGYLYGQVGPTWKDDSLGASKAFFVNVELIIPVTADLNTRAVIFYDGGAGWDTPYFCEFKEAARQVGLSFEKDLNNNNFFYRHSFGVGVRMKSPQPFKVDFGIKLNPSKKFRKHLTEMHFSMDTSF